MQKQKQQQQEKSLIDKMHDPDLDEYLTEYRLQTPVEPISHYEGKYPFKMIYYLPMIAASAKRKAQKKSRELRSPKNKKWSLTDGE